MEQVSDAQAIYQIKETRGEDQKSVAWGLDPTVLLSRLNCRPQVHRPSIGIYKLVYILSSCKLEHAPNNLLLFKFMP